jgi:aspartyl-tRNA(Asn)/glutamyl-tRNA(Gln) amidotransferase subunit B
MRGELLRECAAAGIRAGEARMTPPLLAELARLIDGGAISARTAHEIFPELFASGVSPATFTAERNLALLSDSGALEAAVDRVLGEYPAEVAGYRGGKRKLLSFFIGKVMAGTGGKADPAAVDRLLRGKLDG